MNTRDEPNHHAAERLAARAAKYHAEVARLRTLAGLPEPSPAQDAPTSEPAVADAAAPHHTGSQDVQQRAGEPHAETEVSEENA